MIELNNICKMYQMGDTTVHALKNVSLKISGGDFMSVQGPSGSGKSTLLNILGILDSADEGSYTLGNNEINRLTQHEAAHYRNRFIGFVFQSFNLIHHKSAMENVALPLYYQGVPRRKRNQLAAEYLDRVGLGERIHHKPSELSGGQSQRVAIARALITKPSLLLADEPTGALDTDTTNQIMDIFKSVHREGTAVLIVTHEPEIAEQTDRLIHMRDGEIHADTHYPVQPSTSNFAPNRPMTTIDPKPIAVSTELVRSNTLCQSGIWANSTDDVSEPYHNTEITALSNHSHHGVSLGNTIKRRAQFGHCEAPPATTPIAPTKAETRRRSQRFTTIERVNSPPRPKPANSICQLFSDSEDNSPVVQ